MTDSDSLLKSYYAARAPEYDRIYRKPERQADLARLQHWLPAQFAGKRVLEVACGTGFWTQFIASVATHVVALDAAVETMQIAATRVPAHKVRFVVGDAYALASDLGRFDAAFAGFWFSHVPRARQRAFLAGLAQALEPGATVILLDNLFVAGSSSPIAHSDDNGNSYQTRTLDDGSSYRVLKNFPTESELRALLTGLGDAITLQRFDYYWALCYQSLR